MDKFERLVVDGAFVERSNGNTPYAEIIYRLHYLENIMEKYKCFTPQDLDQRIAELEEEKEEFKKINKNFFQAISNYPNAMVGQRKRIDELTVQVKKLQEENAKLQEQLKNTAPKFKTYQLIYYIDKYYDRTKNTDVYNIFDDHYYVAENENEIIIGWNYAKDFNQRKYSYVRKDWVFATEAEAQKYLEEHK